MKNLTALFCAAIAFCSCSSTNLMSLSVMQPAPVTIPPYIKNVGIIDRSRADDKNKTLDAIHRVVSLESSDLQKEGADAGTRGLADELTKNNRFTDVKVINTDLR